MNKINSVALRVTRRKPFTALLLSLLAPVPAQAAGPVAPDAGSILQQVQPATPPAPSSSVTGLLMEQDDSSTLRESVPFTVNAIEISGSTLFERKALHALVADAEGSELSLSQLGELAARVTNYYRRRGYPLARAIIPAQTITAGVVRFEVFEARYGSIQLDNNSRVAGALTQATLSSLQSGQVIGDSAMDRSLLLLSDIPGVVVGATLRPGEALGTSDLYVNTIAAEPVWGNMVVDNSGAPYTGKTQVGGSINFNNPLEHGDVLSVSALSSGSGLQYGRLSYDVLVNGAGSRVGGAFSALRYELGERLEHLEAHGAAQLTSLWAKHSLIRSRKLNSYAHAQYDHMQLRDHVDAGGLRLDRDLSLGTLNLSGDAFDGILAGGITTWSLSWTTGQLDFKDTSAEIMDGLTGNTSGGFSKWSANFSRLQSLSAKTALYLGLSGQWAQNNLDSSQKMSVGGASSVRSYDPGAASGDSGYRGSLELQHALGRVWRGTWEVLAFVDSAQLTVNKDPWLTGINRMSVSGAGVGLNWRGDGRSSITTYLAAPMGTEPEQVDNIHSTRAWVEVSKRF